MELPQLPKDSREGHILEGLTHSPLISIVKMCYSGCKAVFTHTNFHIIKKGVNIIIVTRDKTSGLWILPLGGKTQLDRDI